MNIDISKLKLQKIDNLFMHDDCDGLSSAVLLTYVFPTKKVFCPEDFGVWDPKPNPAKNYEPPDVVTDMIPQDPNWSGICFDHHPNHAPISIRKYTLIFDEQPATGIVFNLFKDKIPEDQHWKAAVGLAGDGAADAIPPYLWQRFPELLDGYSSPYEKYGLKIYSMPVYMKLISFINASCKIPEKWYVGYQVLHNAKHPFDILEDPALNACKDTVDEEYRRIIKNSNPYEFPYLRIWRIDTEMKLERTIGWKSEETDHKTTLVINSKTGRISVRGVLALVIYSELKKIGYNVSGHPGFGGGRLTEKQTPESLVRDLRKIRLI